MKLLLFILACNCFSLRAQDIIDNDGSGDPETTQSKLDAFELYQANPLVLSEARISEISMLPGISNALARDVKATIKSCKECKTITHLLEKLIHKPDPFICQVLQQCTIVYPEEHTIKGRYRLRYTLPSASVKGIENGQFQGSSQEYLQRLYLQSKHVQCSFIQAKQYGEPFRFGTFNYGLLYSDTSTIIALGDFKVEHGLGTLFSPIMRIRDYQYPTKIFSHWSSRFTPSTSTLESLPFHGIGIQKDISLFSYHCRVRGLYSHKKRSATINDSMNITGFPSSGYYRTNAEIQSYNAADEIRLGFTSEVYSDFHTIGFAGLFVQYNNNVESQSAFSFKERQSLLLTISQSSSFKNSPLQCSSEYIINHHGVIGACGSMLFHHDSIKVGMGFRYYPYDIVSPFGKTFGRYSQAHNDIGINAAIEFPIHSQLEVSASFDAYSSIYPRYSEDIPIHGMLSTFQCTTTLYDNPCMIRLIHETSLQQSSINSQKESALFNTLRIRAEYQMKNKKLLFIIRGEYSQSAFSSREIQSSGFGYSITVKPKEKKPFHYSFQASFASTTHSENAVYFSSLVLPGELYIKPLYGYTIHTSLLIGYTLKSLLTCNLISRYTVKPRESFIGSGLMAKQGNKEIELLLQCDIQF